jgi:hypothetical protein
MDRADSVEGIKYIFSQIIFIPNTKQKRVRRKKIGDFSWSILQTFTKKNSQLEA